MHREILSNNLGWQFYRAGEEQNKETVCLPHTVKLTPANSSGGRNYQGLCTYEKELWIEASRAGQKVLLEFEGAMGYTELYLNGELLQQHYCGYTPLVADITDRVKFGQANRLKLILDNRDNDQFPPGKPQATLDFTYDGGLYRDARIIFTGKVYITNALLANEVAGGGIFVTYPKITETEADVAVKTHVKNESEVSQTVTVRQELFDSAQNPVARSVSREVCLQPGEAQHISSTLTVINPTLWSMDEPNLYLLKTSVCQDGQVVDNVETEIGLRTFEFTLDRGTIFNGKVMNISGANYHQTFPYLGNAVPNSLLKRDLMKLKSAGMQNIRSHYPFSSYFMSQCDRLGLSVIVSNVGWQFYQDGIFHQRMCQNMRNIIRWHRNHPSIILWEPMLNETGMSAEDQKLMHELVHEEYPGPLCFTASDFGPTDVGYSEYDPNMIGTGLEKFGFHEQENPKPRPLWIREYGDFPDNYWDQNAVWRTPREWGDFAMWQTVERMIGRFDVTGGEHNYVDLFNRKHLCGYGVWPGIEHNRGYHINPCWGGFFDLFRIPKFIYHFMRSQQDIEKVGPVLFMANYWLECSSGDISFYSNAEKIRLYHDDVLVGEQGPDEDVAVAHPPFTFYNVRRRFKGRDRSVLKAEAIYKGQVVETLTVRSPGVPKRLHLEADSMGIPLKADGADIMVVQCTLRDDENAIVPLTGDNHLLRFEIEGEGKIIGDGENIGANPVYPKGGYATILVQATTTPGDIRIKVHVEWPQYIERDIYNLGLCDSIADAELTLTSVEK